MAPRGFGRRRWPLLVVLCLLLFSSICASFAANSLKRQQHSTSRNGLFIFVATGAIGDNVRVCLRSLAVNAPNSNVVLIADAVLWKHLRKEITGGVKGLNLVVLNYDRIVATLEKPLNDAASARFYCIARALEEVLRGPGTHYTESTFAYHNATVLPAAEGSGGIPRDIGAVLTSDTRDVVFQRDPFAQFWFEMDKAGAAYRSRGLFVLSEEAPRLLTQSIHNHQWVNRCFGERVAPVLGNVYCSGSFMASPLVFLSFVRDSMVPAMQQCKSPTQGFDQGVFNTITHFPYYSQLHSEDELFKNAFVDDKAREVYKIARSFYENTNPLVVISSYVSGWMTTMGGSYFDEEKQRIMTRNGSTPRACALCHQFDRNEALVRRFDAQFNEPLNAPLPQCTTWDKDPYSLGDSCLFPSQDELLHKQVRNLMHTKGQKIPLCVGVIAYQGYRTLDNTLSSYVKNGLFDLVQESVILFQKIDSPSRKAYAQHFLEKYPKFSLPPIIERNNTVFRAFNTIARKCTAPYVMVLEEDFALYVEDVEKVVEELFAAIYLIEHRNMSAVRMRRRDRMGEPDYAMQLVKRGGKLDASHLFAHVGWLKNPEDDFSEDILHVCLRAPKAFCSTSFNADYTNNPTLYRTDFLRELMKMSPGDPSIHVRKFEIELINAWRPKRYGVAWASGLFTHERLDREMGLPKVKF